MTNSFQKKITILIPCYNEESGIGDVIKGFNREELKASGFDTEIIVIDNNSKDRTGEIARELGATVIVEKNKGKGNAMRTGC
jgi:glycosyltransferase involved in cell wall biosynthesis